MTLVSVLVKNIAVGAVGHGFATFCRNACVGLHLSTFSCIATKVSFLLSVFHFFLISSLRTGVASISEFPTFIISKRIQQLRNRMIMGSRKESHHRHFPNFERFSEHLAKMTSLDTTNHYLPPRFYFWLCA